MKNFFRKESEKYKESDNPFYKTEVEPKLKIITKKAVKPSPEEIKINPRSRSAKLRAAEII